MNSRKKYHKKNKYKKKSYKRLGKKSLNKYKAQRWQGIGGVPNSPPNTMGTGAMGTGAMGTDDTIPTILPTKKPGRFKRAMKYTGRKTVKGARAVGRAAKNTVKAMGRGAKKVATRTSKFAACLADKNVSSGMATRTRRCGHAAGRRTWRAMCAAGEGAADIIARTSGLKDSSRQCKSLDKFLSANQRGCNEQESKICKKTCKTINAHMKISPENYNNTLSYVYGPGWMKGQQKILVNPRNGQSYLIKLPYGRPGQRMTVQLINMQQKQDSYIPTGVPIISSTATASAPITARPAPTSASSAPITARPAPTSASSAPITGRSVPTSPPPPQRTFNPFGDRVGSLVNALDTEWKKLENGGCKKSRFSKKIEACKLAEAVYDKANDLLPKSAISVDGGTAALLKKNYLDEYKKFIGYEVQYDELHKFKKIAKELNDELNKDGVIRLQGLARGWQARKTRKEMNQKKEKLAETDRKAAAALQQEKVREAAKSPAEKVREAAVKKAADDKEEAEKRE
jgi:hypothetical protein